MLRSAIPGVFVGRGILGRDGDCAGRARRKRVCNFTIFDSALPLQSHTLIRRLDPLSDRLSDFVNPRFPNLCDESAIRVGMDSGLGGPVHCTLQIYELLHNSELFCRFDPFP
jgi:hypothetical protein